MIKESSYPINITVNNLNKSNENKRQNKNKITSTRYTCYSFIPIVFIQQFQIIPNFYFLIIVLLTCIIDTPYDISIDVFPLAVLIILYLL